MKKLYYAGIFPPPYGGVTIKNSLLEKRLSEHFEIEKPKSTADVFRRAMTLRKPVIVGFSAVKKKSLLYTAFLYFFNRTTMQRSIYFMMGGKEAARIASSGFEVKMYKHYRAIFVETESMYRRLRDAGLKNVELYPNCREKKEYPAKGHEGFKCVYFSLISATKGADLAVKAAETYPGIEFDFYGELDPVYKDRFFSAVESLPNAKYGGVFNASEANVFEKLNAYDVLLFPTRWKNEGVPGVLVESKFAGIPAIASDLAYNQEIVEHGKDGLVFKTDDTEAFLAQIQLLYEDRKLLQRLKEGALESSVRYDIDHYLERIEELLG